MLLNFVFNIRVALSIYVSRFRNKKVNSPPVVSYPPTERSPWQTSRTLSHTFTRFIHHPYRSNNNANCSQSNNMGAPLLSIRRNKTPTKTSVNNSTTSLTQSAESASTSSSMTMKSWRRTLSSSSSKTILLLMILKQQQHCHYPNVPCGYQYHPIPKARVCKLI